MKRRGALLDGLGLVGLGAIEPVVVAAVASELPLLLVGPHGTGKSLLLLEMCAALATGKAILGRAASEPVDVLYVDYEMTPADLLDRLTTFGYGPDDDLSRLHYALLPSIDPLDTHTGGLTIISAAIAYRCALVCIDTTARAVSGPENEADTFRAFYRHTGLGLKAAGIALVRNDHTGKDAGKGQRGSSAKNDDVDIVWEMTRADNGMFTMTATHRRMGWVPEKVGLFAFNYDFGVNSLRQFLAMSWGGQAGGALAIVILAHALPLDTPGRCMVVAASVGAFFFAGMIEWPVLMRVTKSANPLGELARIDRVVIRRSAATGLAVAVLSWILLAF